MTLSKLHNLSELQFSHLKDSDIKLFSLDTIKLKSDNLSKLISTMLGGHYLNKCLPSLPRTPQFPWAHTLWVLWVEGGQGRVKVHTKINEGTSFQYGADSYNLKWLPEAPFSKVHFSPFWSYLKKYTMHKRRWEREERRIRAKLVDQCRDFTLTWW